MPFEDFREVLYGAQEYEGDAHFTGFTPDSFCELLREAGFVEPADRRIRPPQRQVQGVRDHRSKGGVVRVSVVICTLNRAESLGATLDCLRHQHHDDFEVIVVNGPSTDATLEVLEPWRDRIRYFDNPERNLSISRNIGIRAVRRRADRLHRRRRAARAGVADAGAPGVRRSRGRRRRRHRVRPHRAWRCSTATAPRIGSAGRAGASTSSPASASRARSSSRTCRARTRSTDATGCSRPAGSTRTSSSTATTADICGRLIDAGWVIRQLPNSAGAPQVPPVGDPRPPADHDELVSGRPRPHVLRAAARLAVPPRGRDPPPRPRVHRPRAWPTRSGTRTAAGCRPEPSIYAEATCLRLRRWSAGRHGSGSVARCRKLVPGRRRVHCASRR